MKKIILLILALGIAGAFPQAAKAEYAVSFRFGDSGYFNRYEHNRPRHNKYRHHDDWRCFPRPSVFYYGRPYHHETTIIRTYEIPSRTQTIQAQEKLGISDIIILSKAKIDDDTIIQKIARTGSVFYLSAEEIETLQKEGVSNRVINFMLSTTKK